MTRALYQCAAAEDTCLPVLSVCSAVAHRELSYLVDRPLHWKTGAWETVERVKLFIRSGKLFNSICSVFRITTILSPRYDLKLLVK